MPAKGGQPHGQSSLLLDARPQALMSVLYTPAGNVLLQPEKVDPFRLRCFLLLAARIADYRSSWAAQRSCAVLGGVCCVAPFEMWAIEHR